MSKVTSPEAGITTDFPEAQPLFVHEILVLEHWEGEENVAPSTHSMYSFCVEVVDIVNVSPAT